MTYIPIIVPPTAPQPPSPRTRELAKLLTTVLEEYTRAHPHATKAEIRAAIKLAAAGAGPDKNMAALSLGLGLGVLMLSAGVGLYVFRAGGAETVFSDGMPMIIMALMTFFLLVAVLVKVITR